MGGPSPHMDINDFRWFSICTNGHSRFNHLYLLKQKSEVAKILNNLRRLVKRHFGVIGKDIRLIMQKDF